MIASKPFMKIFGAGEHAQPDKVAKVACEAGYAVVPVKPGGKIPICSLNTTERKRADKAAVDAGRQRHECGVTEYITDPAKAQRVFARLTKEYGGARVNIGIVAHPSRIIVVDADQAAEVRAFQEQWAANADDTAYLQRRPTVMSPGVVEGAEWKHKDGGHFLFSVPDGIVLPTSPGFYKDPGGFDVKWGMSQSLVPTSVRPEGPYVATGDIIEAPDWLLAKISQRIADHELHLRAKNVLVANDSVAAWSVETSWASLLTEDDWTETFKTDSCGCPIFTRPGGGTTSWKSATGHNGDCPNYENVEQHGPLHLWSTNCPPPLDSGKSTWTKLQYVVAVRYAGDEEMAMAALGLSRVESPDVDEWIASMDEHLELEADEPEPLPKEVEADAVATFLTAKGIPTSHHKEIKTLALNSLKRELAIEVADIIAVEEKRKGNNTTGSIILTGAALLEALDNPIKVEPELGVRSDGMAILYRGRTSVVAARPGTGKSWLSILVAQQVLDAGGKVLIIDFEDGVGLSTRRLSQVGVNVRAAIMEGRLAYVENQMNMTMADFTYSLTEAIAMQPDYIVVDSANALISEFGDITDNTLVTQLYKKLGKAAEASNASMLIIDHLPKNKDQKSAIGAQAKQAALTGTFFLLEPIKPFKPGAGGMALLSFFEKDRLGGVAAYAVDGQVAVMRMTPNMEAPDGMSVFDGLDLTLEPIPAGGVDMSQASQEERALEGILAALRDHFPGEWVAKTAFRNKMASDLRTGKVFDEALKSLVDDKYIEVQDSRPVKYRWVPLELEGGES